MRKHKILARSHDCLLARDLIGGRSFYFHISVYKYDARHHRYKHKHKRMHIFPFSCACVYARVVRLNQDDVSVSINTRRLYLRRTGLHAGFLCLCFCRLTLVNATCVTFSLTVPYKGILHFGFSLLCLYETEKK